MKIKLMVSDKKHKEIKDYLLNHGIEIDDDAELVLYESSKYIEHIIVKTLDRQDKLYISTKDIIFIESFSHDVYIHTINDTYITSDPLRQLELLLDPKIYIRINTSMIVNRMYIKEIRPALSMKFTLKMIDDSLLDVTRTYYSSFKDILNL